MSVTEEMSQEDKSPSKLSALKNMNDMSVTSVKSGASVALYTMCSVPSKARSIEPHWVEPHWSIERSCPLLNGLLIPM